MYPEKEIYKRVITSLRDHTFVITRLYNSVRGVRAIFSTIQRGIETTKISFFQALYVNFRGAMLQK